MRSQSCIPSCVLAPYTPPDDPDKSRKVVRPFGLANMRSFLGELPPSDREAAVISLISEAERWARGDQPSSPHFARLISDFHLKFQIANEIGQRSKDRIQSYLKQREGFAAIRKKNSIMRKKRKTDLRKLAAAMKVVSIEDSTVPAAPPAPAVTLSFHGGDLTRDMKFLHLED